LFSPVFQFLGGQQNGVSDDEGPQLEDLAQKFNLDLIESSDSEHDTTSNASSSSKENELPSVKLPALAPVVPNSQPLSATAVTSTTELVRQTVVIPQTPQQQHDMRSQASGGNEMMTQATPVHMHNVPPSPDISSPGPSSSEECDSTGSMYHISPEEEEAAAEEEDGAEWEQEVFDP
jgi:hypothetical protein